MIIDVNELKGYIIKIFTSLGIKQEEAVIVADCYLEADLCGVTTHGANILTTHLEKIEKHIYNVKPRITIIKSEAAFAVTDGDNSIGPVSGYFNMKLAIEKAKKSGIYTVFSKNNNTLGAAFYYNDLAVKEKLIGITFCNSPASMAPINGKQKLLGTNPFAISIPANMCNPIVFDMATSAVAKSKIKQALIENKEIPIGWATDSNGADTTDPKEALNGLVLPMAGHKGFGLAMMIDILSGVLSGAAYLDAVGRFYNTDKCMNVGFTFIAIDPVQIYGEDFFNDIDEYIKKIKESPAKENANISVPGEDRIKRKEANMKKGIELYDSTFETLKKYLEKFHIPNKL